LVEIETGVNVGVNAILMLIENNPGINILTMAKDFNVSQRTIERWINQLKKIKLNSKERQKPEVIIKSVPTKEVKTQI
jgi:predicted DNA-binding transcriptional regulator YafY